MTRKGSEVRVLYGPLLDSQRSFVPFNTAFC